MSSQEAEARPRSRDSKRVGPLKGLLLSALALLLLLALAEFGCRLAGYSKGPASYYDPRIGSRFHPNQTRSIDVRRGEGVIELEINGLGLRGPEPKATAGRPRIACLGDSFTFGWGVHGDETYPEALAELLADVPGFESAEVLNFGTPGYNSWNELQLYRHVLRAFAPDIVVVGFYGNDLKPDGGGTALDEVLALRYLTRFTPALAEVMQRRFFSRMEIGKRHVPPETRRRLAMWRKSQHEIMLHPDREAWRDMWTDCMGDLRTLLEEIRADGARALVVTFPTPQQSKAFAADPETGGERSLTPMERRVREQSEAADARFLTLFPDFGRAGDGAWGELHRTHPSVEGYRMSAERIAAALRELL